MGRSKATVLKKVLEGPISFRDLPIQKVGTWANKALWVIDTEAASQLTNIH